MTAKEKLYDLIKKMPDETVYEVMLILDASAALTEARPCGQTCSRPASKGHPA